MLLNTLDRYLVRRNPFRPSAEVIIEPEEESAGRNDAGSSGEDIPDICDEEKRARPGTLETFLVRCDATAQASTSGHSVDEQNTLQTLPASLLSRQVTGRLSQPAAASLKQLSACHFHEAASLGTHAWGRTALSSHGAVSRPCDGLEGTAHIQALHFDSGGELLITGSTEGLLSVHSTKHIMQHLAPRADGAPLGCPSPQGALDPLLLIDCGMWRLSSVAWDARDENVVGVASTATNQLRLYDLAHTQGRPRETLTVPQQSATLGLAGSVAVGLSDLVLPGARCAYTQLAGGVGGQVFLWDQRARPTPQACLQSQQSGAVNTLQLVAGGEVVVAGTQSGEIKVWDLRGGSGGTLRFGGSLHHHPLLSSLSIRHALTAVPGLADQTAVPPTAVHWIQADPRDERRLGFHLGCGWSGVLDLSRHVITHLHAPPQHAEDSVEHAPAFHRHPCWDAAGCHLLTPCRHSAALHLLDCAPSRHAACAVLSERPPPALTTRPSGGWGGTQGSSGGGPPELTLPSAVQVPLYQPGICTASHPQGGLIILGGARGRLSAVVSR